MVDDMNENKKVTDGLRDKVLSEHACGNIVFWTLSDQLATTNLCEFIKQPIDGILYDLNRSEEVILTFLGDPKWVNDFAATQVIRKLYGENAAMKEELDQTKGK